MFAIACAGTLFMQAGCETASRGDFCSIYAPVYTAKEDTAETQRQADDNNALWMELCSRSYAP